MAKSKFPILDKFGVNLTELARQGKLEVLNNIYENKLVTYDKFL